MKALMFGWEWPPHILGGLGPASYGIVRGVVNTGECEVTFVLPKPQGDEKKDFVHIIGAANTPVVWRDVNWEYVQQRYGYCMDPQEYFDLRNCIYADFNHLYTNDLGCIDFSGRYPKNLLEEINNYSIVAGVIARKEHFDIIHAHDWLTYPAGIHAKQVSGKPLCIHVHATQYDRTRGMCDSGDPTFIIEKDGMDHADLIMCVSELTRRTVIEKYHQDPAKCVAVHNAVEPMSPDILNMEAHRGTDEKVITFLGRITAQKGCEYFVEAAARCLRKAPHARVVMAGNGDLMEPMIRLVAKKGLADRFHFTGFLRGRQVYEMFKVSDVYVMPSVSEPFGISPLEAMQCGVPSIISKQSGCGEILDHCFKCDYWDIDAMADAMYALITYPQLHAHMRQAGIDEVSQITWEKVGRKVVDHYKRLLGWS
jgi:glycosyltransferase involved in cell wall biosynthesis